jgi:hypothetical protein
MKRMACVLALATGTGLAVGVTVRPAFAETAAVVVDGFQISIASTGAVTDDAAVPLEVHYQGGPVGSIELTIDGAPVKKRTLNSRKGQGTIRFEIDPELLGAGDHDVMISATDREGHTATATVHLHVDSLDMGGFARMLSPRKNSTVQGIVPIEVTVSDSVRRPFVSFFVDQDFSLLNFAPFTYNWDSTRAANGPHTISVEVMDGETQEIVRRFVLQVNVNNPGGFTSRQPAIRDLNQPDPRPHQPARGLVDAAHAAARIAVPGAHFDLSSVDHSLAGHTRPSGELPGALHNRIPNLGIVFVDNKPLTEQQRTAHSTSPREDRLSNILPDFHRVTNLFGSVDSLQPRTDLKTRDADITISRPDHNKPAPRFTNDTISRPGTLGLFASAHALLKLDHAGIDTGPSVRTRLRSRRIGNIAAMPRADLGEGAISAAPGARDQAVTAGRPLRGIQSTASAVVVNAKGAFQVAFDNSQIAFDVPPRVEKGLPLAPFRQIFEHTGGSVKWYGQSHTVHAYNSTREIEFTVGQNSARVNNHAVKMDAKSYIDHGRAIVPLTFVRDSMNVSVHYDAATGHIRIESRH